MVIATVPIWWSTTHVQAWAMVLFSFPFPRQRGIAVFCEGEVLCGRCSRAIGPLVPDFSWSISDGLLARSSIWVVRVNLHTLKIQAGGLALEASGRRGVERASRSF